MSVRPVSAGRGAGILRESFCCGSLWGHPQPAAGEVGGAEGRGRFGEAVAHCGLPVKHVDLSG